MKKAALFLLTIGLFCISAYSQKCKYDYDKKDSYSGKQTKGISATISKGWKIGFNKTDGTYNVGIAIVFPGVKEDVINANDTLMIAMEGGEPMHFLAMERITPTSNVSGTGAYAQVVSYYQGFYNATEEQLKTLSEGTPLAVRVFFGKTFYSVEINKKNKVKIPHAAGCILQ